LNNEVKGKQAKITLINDKDITGENIILGLDSTSWDEFVEKSKKEYDLVTTWRELVGKMTVATQEIKKIEMVSRSQGAKGGISYGFLVGAGIGFVNGLYWQSEGFPGGGQWEIGQTLLWSALLGVAGAIVGLPVGLIAGGTDEYILNRELNADR
jgi:hypothetical protein